MILLYLLPIILPTSGVMAAIKFLGWKWEPRTWIYLPCCMVLCSLLTWGICGGAKYGKASFSEVWHFKNIAVSYYEDWNERVHCRHPKYKTQTHTRIVNGKSQTYTVTVQDGWQHAYDVDYHPEDWTSTDERGIQHSISKKTYNEWKSLWNNSQFVDLHRNYHTNDGDKYESKWDHEFDHIYCYNEFHSYQNRVRASDHSVFKFEKPTPELLEKYPRPVDGGNANAILYYGIQPAYLELERFNRLNSVLGPIYEVHVLIMLFDATQYGAEEVQRVKSAWEGPNKNEFVICVGLDKTHKVVWCEPFSWMSDTTLHAKMRQALLDLPQFSYEKMFVHVRDLVPRYWKRRDFDEFDYLTVDTPTWAVIVAVVINFLVSVGGLFLIHKYLEEPYARY